MLDRNLHRTILLQILKDIYSDSSLGPLMGFKGGTAAHFFYGLDRFSVDLDFDLLREDKELYVFEKLGEILPEYGTLREKRRKNIRSYSCFLMRRKLRTLKLRLT